MRIKKAISHTLPQPILIIMTGGTIDSVKEYDPDKPVIVVESSLVPQAVRTCLPRLASRCEFQQWKKMQGSEDFDLPQLKDLAAFIRSVQQSYVIVTHGTAMMSDNARKLQELLEGSGKTILFTGSMTPLSHGNKSDAVDNLKTSIQAFTENIPPGVWVAMPHKENKPQILYTNGDLAKKKDHKPPYFIGTQYPINLEQILPHLSK